MKYRAVAFDIDGTITSHASSWQFIHEKLGIWDSRAEKYQRLFHAGEITYEKFCELDAAEWKGAKESDVAALFSEIPCFPNAAGCLRKLKQEGFILAAISTGLQYIPERLEKEFGFDAVLCNRLLSDESGRLNGRVEISVSHAGKGEALLEMLENLKVPPKETIGVGDSAGDIPVAEACGYFIAFNPTSRELEEKADRVCSTNDFSEVMQAILKAAGKPFSRFTRRRFFPL